MKKHRGRRNFFVICGIVMALGLALFTVGFAAGGVDAMSKMSERYSWFHGPTDEWEYASTGSGISFDSVEVSGDLDVEIQRGTENNAQIKYEKDASTYSMDVENGVLKVEYELEGGLVVNLRGDDDVPTLVITRKDGEALKMLTANLSWGDIEIRGVDIESIAAKTDTGDIDIETTLAEAMYTIVAKSGTGEIDINDRDSYECGGEYRSGSGAKVMDLRTSAGDISVDFGEYDHLDSDDYFDDDDDDD